MFLNYSNSSFVGKVSQINRDTEQIVIYVDLHKDFDEVSQDLFYKFVFDVLENN